MPRDRMGLKNTAIPTIFPNCPSYLTDRTEKSKRVSRDDKDEIMLREAFSMSRIDDKTTVVKFQVNTFAELLTKLDLNNDWVTYNPGTNSFYFLKIVLLANIPSIERTLIIDHDLNAKALYMEKHPIQLSTRVINDIRQIETLIDEVNCYSLPQNLNITSITMKNYVEHAISDIGCAITQLDDLGQNSLSETGMEDSSSMKIRLHFLLDQLSYLITDKYSRRYSIITQVFALKLHGISPAGYRLILSSNCLILPHERNILKIKNSNGLENEYFNVLKETATTFSQLDRHVIVQMDEVHIRSDASYKGGRIIGSIENPEDPPTTVFSIMVSSLAKKYSTIVRLIPLGSSSAEILFPIIRKTISDIESCNLFVEAICTDNYPLNVSLFKLFPNDSKTLQPKVKHPCNPARNLILLFDIVHIIKSIRNNWLNLHDHDKTFVFPLFEDCFEGY